jgi:hypothetical protein
MTSDEIDSNLKLLANDQTAQCLQRFFKIGTGEYGAGDRFHGIRVPVLRKLAREYQAIGVDETIRLLRSPFHEARLLTLLILARCIREVKKQIRRVFINCI